MDRYETLGNGYKNIAIDRVLRYKIFLECYFLFIGTIEVFTGTAKER